MPVDSSIRSKLFQAVQYSSIGTLNVLKTEIRELDNYEHLYSVDDSGMTVLHYAAEKGNVEVLKILLDDIQVPLRLMDSRGGSALLEAAAAGHIAATRFLVEKGIQVDEADGRGDTPMHVAAAGGHLPVMAFLFESGASLDKRTTLGVTPMLYATSKNQLDAMKWLKSKGAQLTVQEENQGWQPVHVAAGNNLVPILKWIFEQDHSLIFAKSREGKTPKEVARLEGCLETYKCCMTLEKLHAKISLKKKKTEDRRLRAKLEADAARQAFLEADRLLAELKLEDGKQVKRKQKRKEEKRKTKKENSHRYHKPNFEPKTEDPVVCTTDAVANNQPTSSTRSEEKSFVEESPVSHENRGRTKGKEMEKSVKPSTGCFVPATQYSDDEQEWVVTVSRKTRRARQKFKCREAHRRELQDRRLKQQITNTNAPPTPSPRSEGGRKRPGSHSSGSGTSLNGKAKKSSGKQQRQVQPLVPELKVPGPPTLQTPSKSNEQMKTVNSRLRPMAPPWSPKGKRWVAWNSSGSSPVLPASIRDSHNTPRASNASMDELSKSNNRHPAVDSPEQAESEFHRMLKKFVHLDAGARRAARQRFAKAALQHEQSRRAKAYAIEINWRQSVKARLDKAMKNQDAVGLQGVLEEVHATQEARTLHEQFDHTNSQGNLDSGSISKAENKKHKSGKRLSRHKNESKNNEIVSTLNSEEESDLFEISKDTELQRYLSLAREHFHKLTTPRLGKIQKNSPSSETVVSKHAKTIVIDLTQHESGFAASELEENLKQSIRAWRFSDTCPIYLRIPTSCGSLVPIATDIGFDFHSAATGSLTMVHTSASTGIEEDESKTEITEDQTVAKGSDGRTNSGKHHNRQPPSEHELEKQHCTKSKNSQLKQDDVVSSEVAALVVRVCNETKKQSGANSHFEILVEERSGDGDGQNSCSWGIPSRTVCENKTVDRAMQSLVKNLKWLSATEQSHSPICVSHSKYSPSSTNTRPNGRDQRSHFVSVLFTSHGVGKRLNMEKEEHGSRFKWIKLEAIEGLSDVCNITKLACRLLLTDSSSTNSDSVQTVLKPQRQAYQAKDNTKLRKGDIDRQNMNKMAPAV